MVELRHDCDCEPVCCVQLMSMSRSQIKRQLVVTGLCLAALGYIGAHGFGGRHGLEGRQRLDVRSQNLSLEVARLQLVQHRLSRDVALLSDIRPDPDFVEELAADVLNYARPKDLILILPTRR
jgi:cell division protein FtsB